MPKPSNGFRFGVVHADIFKDPLLKPAAFGIYAALSTFADQSGRCFPSHATLIRYLNFGHKATLINHLRMLEERGFIHRIRNRKERLVTNYSLTLFKNQPIEKQPKKKTPISNDEYFVPGAGTVKRNYNSKVIDWDKRIQEVVKKREIDSEKDLKDYM